MSNIHCAIQLVVEAHQGHKDKSGADYIYHPLRVMLAMDTDELRMVAVLHDVVEDTLITLADLEDFGFSEAVMAGVDAVTRRLGESYVDYIRRAKADSLGRVVKIADIQDNLGRLDYITNETTRTSLRKRYEKGLIMLYQEEGG